MTKCIIKVEDIKGVCELCQHLNNTELCENCRYQPLGEGMEDLWEYRDGLAVQQAPKGFEDGADYLVQNEAILLVNKSGHRVRLWCPYSQDACTLGCPQCYEEPVYETRFGPAGQLRPSEMTGTRLVTCGQTFFNKKEAKND